MERDSKNLIVEDFLNYVFRKYGNEGIKKISEDDEIFNEFFDEFFEKQQKIRESITKEGHKILQELLNNEIFRKLTEI